MEVVVTMLWVLDMKFPVAGVKSGVMGCQHNSTTLTGNGFEVKCDTNDTFKSLCNKNTSPGQDHSSVQVQPQVSFHVGDHHTILQFLPN